MSKIDQLIQDLQLKKKKLDYLIYIQDILKGDTRCIDFMDVKEEVLNKLELPIKSLMAEIEGDAVPEEKAPISTENQRILNDLAEKLKTGQVPKKATQSSAFNNPELVTPPEQPLGPQEKMDFAMDNRHLAAKTVSVFQGPGSPSEGPVVGLDAPFVLVQTPGGVVKALLGNISIKEF